MPGTRGGVVLSAEQSQGGDALSTAALRDGEQQQRLKCCRLKCAELTTKGKGQKRGEKSRRARRKIKIKKNNKAECACD